MQRVYRKDILIALLLVLIFGALATHFILQRESRPAGQVVLKNGHYGPAVETAKIAAAAAEESPTDAPDQDASSALSFAEKAVFGDDLSRTLTVRNVTVTYDRGRV